MPICPDFRGQLVKVWLMASDFCWLTNSVRRRFGVWRVRDAAHRSAPSPSDHTISSENQGVDGKICSAETASAMP